MGIVKNEGKRTLKQIYNFLVNRSQSFILTLGFSLLLLVSILDYLSGRDAKMDLFYLLPILLITWFASTEWAIVAAVLTSLVWVIVNRFIYNLLIDTWNIFIDLGVFQVFIVVLSVLKRDIQRLNELAYEDGLTGIANSRYFYKVAEIEINRSQRFGKIFSVVYIDVDDFKIINDTLGHNTGDTVLAEIATTICQHVREVDTVARLGGDEFAIIFPETDLDGVKHGLAKIQRILTELTTHHHWPITFSMGVVTFAKPPASAQEMIGFADQVMYSVKKQGKNSIAFEVWPKQLIVDS